MNDNRDLNLPIIAHAIPHPAVAGEGAILLDDGTDIWIAVESAAEIAPDVLIATVHILNLRRARIEPTPVNLAIPAECRRAAARISTGLFSAVLLVGNFRELVRRSGEAAGDALDVWLCKLLDGLLEAREEKKARGGHSRRP